MANIKATGYWLSLGGPGQQLFNYVSNKRLSATFRFVKLPLALCVDEVICQWEQHRGCCVTKGGQNILLSPSLTSLQNMESLEKPALK